MNTRSFARSFGLFVLLGTTHSLAAASNELCKKVQLPVALAAGFAADQTLSGTLCRPAECSGAPQVDILVHGATYSRRYWDFPVKHPQYSYVERALNAQRATFAYDRLGVGQSSRPLSPAVTITSDAYVLHQVVQWLRTQQQFSQVNVVGHSFGSIVGIQEAATYEHIDRLVVTGLLHAVGSGQAAAIGNFYPAALDPQFSASNPDSGYLTTRAGTRGSMFYHTLADAQVIGYDEAHKHMVSSTQFAQGIAQLQTPAGLNVSNQVRVPVLVIAAQYDPLYCGLPLDCSNPLAVKANETPYYTSARSLKTFVVPATGHNLALHPTAGLSFWIINHWLTTTP